MANFQTSDGLTLYYEDKGAGIPVLCLSGLTRNTGDFSYIDGQLPGARVIKMDYRGRGRSDWAEDFSTYNVPRESMDAFELMDHLGLKRFAILGSSRGGLCALTMGAIQMDRLLGVAFNDIGPVIDPKGIDVIMNYIGRPPIWKTMAEAAAARAALMPGFHNVPAQRWREECEKLFVQTPQGLMNTYDPKLRDAILGASLQEVPDLWPFYAAFAGKPVAVIRGANSDLLSRETFDKMQTTLPEAIMADVPDRAHIPFLDEPEALNALHKWLAALNAAQ